MPGLSEWFSQFLRFFASSAAGLVTDLGLFQLGILVGLPPWAANASSATTAITVVYFLAVRFAFGTDPRPATYALFFGWYATSVVVSSTVIQFASSMTDVTPFIWKLATIPISFVLNYLFSRFLFRDRARG